MRVALPRLARLAQFGRAQQAADMVGAEAAGVVRSVKTIAPFKCARSLLRRRVQVVPGVAHVLVGVDRLVDQHAV